MTSGAKPTRSTTPSTGNLDRRGIGDLPTMTVAEYRAKGRVGAASIALSAIRCSCSVSCPSTAFSCRTGFRSD
jgi:hypothetical protein